jgi:beta-xylosidase
MKRFLLILLLAAGPACAPALAQTTQKEPAAKATFSNPLPVQFGDPYVLYTGGRYYMYGTGGGAEKGFAAYSSTDLVNWKEEGQVYFHDNKTAGAIRMPAGAVPTGHRKCTR